MEQRRKYDGEYKKNAVKLTCATLEQDLRATQRELAEVRVERTC